MKSALFLYALFLGFSGLSAPAGVDFLDYSPSLDAQGRIWFPGNLAGRLPLVLLAHGNGFGHGDYQFLVEPLVAQGYAVACVQAGEDSGIQERAHGLVHHLDYLFATYPNTLSGEVALVGHSRGGEAVIHAANQLAESAYRMSAVISMAPSYQDPLVPLSTKATRNLLVLYGTHDTDIAGYFEDNLPLESPFGLYDAAFPRADPDHRKVLLFIFGGSHSGFSDSDEVEAFPDGGAPAYLTPLHQRKLAARFVSLFLRWTLSADEEAGTFVRRRFLPSGPDDQNVFFTSLYEGDLVARVDDFEDHYLDRNLMGGKLYGLNQVGMAQNEHFALDPFSPHRGRGLMVWWRRGKDNPAPTVVFELGACDLSNATHVSFNAAIRYQDPANMEGKSQDFHIRLVAANGKADVRVGDWCRLEYPNTNIQDEPPYGDFTKAALQTVQIPLSAFRGIAIDQLKQVQLIFDVPRSDGETAGCLLFDNLGFHQMSWQ